MHDNTKFYAWQRAGIPDEQMATNTGPCEANGWTRWHDGPGPHGPHVRMRRKCCCACVAAQAGPTWKVDASTGQITYTERGTLKGVG